MSDKKLNTKDYERIGREFENVVQSGYSSHKRLYLLSFLRGMFFGLGSVVGASIIISALAGLLSLFNELPFIGDIAEAVENAINQ